MYVVYIHTYVGRNSYSENVDINQLMNIVPFIQEKWSFIGTRLKISPDKLDDIYRKSTIDNIPSESKNTFCCIKMLTQWHQESKDVSIITLMNAIDALHVGLEEKIPSIKAALASSCIQKCKDPSKYLTSPPERCDRPYTSMKANVSSELKLHHTVSKACDYLKSCGTDPDVTDRVKDFAALFNSLESHGLLNKINVEWLECIAEHFKCKKALEIIQEYEQQLIADKINWCSNSQSSHQNGTYLAASINKKPEHITIKEYNDAKTAASKLVKIAEEDSISGFSEVGSVTFYWRIIAKDRGLNIPKTINDSVMKDCKAVGLTHIGIMTDGDLNMTKIDELKIIEGTPYCMYIS